MNLTELSLFEAAPLLARRELSPVALVQAYLERIASLDPVLNAFITVTGDRALEEAQVAGKEIASGTYRGPLHGIPIALKDLYETQGIPTTAASKFFADNIPAQDGFAVSKLKKAGAILLGKLNMHEIALGVTNETSYYGECNNPWNPDCISGGSSGGSAAALAAGLCLGSLGSDTGGSIRIPASLCGVVGLKPTYGRVSLRGVIPLSWNLDHPGPMARSVHDTAVLLQAVAGYDPQDPASVNLSVGDYLYALDQGVRGWRVALASDEFFTRADQVVLDAVRSAAGQFSELGAEVSEVNLPEARQAAQANGLLVTSDAAAFHAQRLKDSPAGFGPDVLERLQKGAAYTSTEYVLARRTQAEIRRRFELFFQEYDLLLTPTTPFPAPRRGSASAVERAGQLTRFTAPFNLTGLPALSLPCGFSPEGLPLGLQIVAAPWAEAALLRAAYAYEEVARWNLRRPELKVNTNG